MHEPTEQVAPVDLDRLIFAGKGLSDGWIRRLQPERYRRDQDLGVVRMEDVVEGAGERRIPIANKEA
jgi:hypothetical protein